ncbi:MAG: hypothetical protein IJB21_05000 [Bacilli bacterium]|nr:hypothetical protein [Bacilli bacterium]
MKKNVMMRLSALLLVAVLLTTCVISGTFAKYVTTAPLKEDSAKVAKWGITMEITGADEVLNAKAGDADATASVLSNDLCAPGTYEELAKFTLSGQPEVAYKIEVTANLTLNNWTVDEDFYCPLVFGIGDTTINGLDYDNATDLQDAVVAAIKTAISGDSSGAKTYNANANAEKNVLIDWTWGFTGDDVKDTALGNAAVNPANAATLAFNLQVTVTQVDHVA